MTEWVVRRWSRYGHERLYAETPGGTPLGHLDLKTGRYHSDDLSNLPLLEKAIAGQHPASPAPTRPVLPAAPGPPPPTAEKEVAAGAVPGPSAMPAPQDLSTTTPGASARERAVAEREAQGWLRHGLARLTGARTDERAWRIGADGEQAVAEQLSRLGPGWRLLHAVPVGDRGADIDHVVIGPAGVFTVNAKHHPHSSVWVGGDTFMVNGHRVPYIRNSRLEARRASRLLTEQTGFPVSARGVIAVVGAHKGITVKKQPEDGQVAVVPRQRVCQYLHALPFRLDPREIDAIFEVARISTTWRD